MAETFAQIEARRKREAAARAARPNTGASQGFMGAIKSLAPGGQAANFGALGRNAVNFAGEVSGVYDINRGVNELKKGNVAGGLGRIALGAVGFVPGVGLASRAVTGAARAAKASKFVTAAAKTKPVTAISASRPITAVKPIVTTAVKPIAKTNAGLQKVTTKAITPMRPGTTTAGRILSPLTSPFAVASLAGGVIGGLTAPTGTTPTYRPAGVTPRGGGGTYLDINTATPGGTGTGTTPGTGGGTGTGPGAGGGTTTTTPTSTAPIIQEPSFGGDFSVNTNTIEGINKASGFTTSAEQTGALATGGGSQAAGGAATVGVPGGVQVAEADYIADKAANAARSLARQAGFREAFAQGIEGVQGSAADIIGGRSQAILGQGITGQRRNLEVAKAADVQRQLSEDEASRKAYSDAVAAAYAKQAQDILDAANRKSELAAKIKRIG